jgi:predicted RNA-binding Zn-ribbon protein involved in translation (DUF1610 family)
MSKIIMTTQFTVLIHEDEQLEPELEWCPNCGCNAVIITWVSRLGKRYRCKCGLYGRFGDGLPEPTVSQPELLKLD